MGFLKRKRSESELSATSSQFSSPPRPSDHGYNTFPTLMDTDSPLSRSIHSTMPSYLPSRTMKRFRNNRPSDEEVHQHTLGLLYQGALQPRPVRAPAFPGPLCNPAISTPRKSKEQQASLHRFFSISSSEPSSEAPSLPSIADPQNCEDCGASICGSAEDPQTSFEFDFSDAECTACRKIVCSRCSISNMGVQRECMICAKRKTVSDAGSIRGIGWLTKWAGFWKEKKKTNVIIQYARERVNGP